jgi:hypothetical protein
MYYTLDGSDPDDRSDPVEGPITIDLYGNDSVTLKVIAYDNAGNPGAIMTETYVQDDGGTESDKMMAATLDGQITVEGGSPTETSMITYEVDFLLEDGDTSVFFPAGTEMTKTGGGTMDLSEMTVEDITDNLRNSSISNIAGAVSVGIPSLNLSFSQPITITIPVGSAYDGQTLSIYFQNAGSSDWSGGLSCLVADGLCIFETDHATKYSAGDEPTDGDSDKAEKAHIDSWDASLFTDLSSCPEKIKVVIKGKHFDDDADVRIGDRKAATISVKNSKQLTAKFCLAKLLSGRPASKRTISVENPDTDKEKADKKIDLSKYTILVNGNGFDPQTTEGVKNIQRALNRLGLLGSSSITGVYGPLTTEAVKKFQADNGISQTGNVGPLTRAKLADKVK